jgi:hypothetical protein
MMEAARTSETLVNIQLRTRQYIPEDSELQEVLVCHKLETLLQKYMHAWVENSWFNG